MHRNIISCNITFCSLSISTGLLLSARIHHARNGENRCLHRLTRPGSCSLRDTAMNGMIRSWFCKPLRISPNIVQEEVSMAFILYNLLQKSQVCFLIWSGFLLGKHLGKCISFFEYRWSVFHGLRSMAFGLHNKSNRLSITSTWAPETCLHEVSVEPMFETFFRNCWMPIKSSFWRLCLC